MIDPNAVPLPPITKEQRRVCQAICAELGEHKNGPTEMILALLSVHGEDAVMAHVERAKQVQAAGGLLRKNGKPRTLGGVFFWIFQDTQDNRRLWRRAERRVARRKRDALSGRLLIAC